MTIRRASVHPYRLPLVEPVAWGGAAHTHREGCLLRLEDDRGAVGWGDAAPLPGFSRETLADVRRHLDALATDAAPDREALASPALPPSASFALDLALADLSARRTGCSLADVIARGETASGERRREQPVGLSDRLPVAGLILAGDAVAHATRLAASGYRTVKLKVGRLPVADDAAVVRAVRDAIGSGVALRLDANRAWSDADARRFADGLAGVEIAFIEEPLRDPDGLEALARETGLPVALDETLHVPGARVPPWAAAVVLKPTLVGGVGATLRLAAEARAAGLPVVLSAAFESGVGTRGVAALAVATGGEAAGLDPYRWLAADVLATRLPVEQPDVRVAALFAHPLDVRLP